MGLIRTICKGKIVLIIENETIDDNITKEILSNIHPTKKIGLDMKGVKTIKSKEFIKNLILCKFYLFNLTSELLCYLSLIIKDGFLKSFINKSDFIFEKRELKRRKFITV